MTDILSCSELRVIDSFLNHWLVHDVGADVNVHTF